MERLISVNAEYGDGEKSTACKWYNQFQNRLVTRRQRKLSFAIYVDMKQIWGKGYLIHSGRNKKRHSMVNLSHNRPGQALRAPGL